VQPHLEVKKSKTEDIAIARLYKNRKLKVECLANIPDIQCRMYTSYAEAVNGFSRNINDYFGGSLFISFIYQLILLVSLPYLYIFADLAAFIVGLIFYVTTILLISKTSSQNVLVNLAANPLQIIVGFHINSLALKAKFKKNLKWKERNIYS
jgi:hypothetical protein